MNHRANLVVVPVIDDQMELRQHIYAEALQRVNEKLGGRWVLEPRFCGSSEEFSAVIADCEEQRAVIAIVDMLLDWRDAKVIDLRFSQVAWPLLLVSAAFTDSAAMARASELMASHNRRRLPAQFFPWQLIADVAAGKADVGMLQFTIECLLAHSFGRDMSLQKSPDDPIDIVHFTDLHFGIAQWIKGYHAGLAVIRKRLKLGRADFIAISGDIANIGARQEYDDAQEYFSSLVLRGIAPGEAEKLNPERVLVCPGNHDFSRALSLSANIAATRVGDAIEYALNGSVQKSNAWVEDLAWIGYERFEEALRGSADRWFPVPGFRMSTRFLNLGVIFLELNVEKFEIPGYRPAPDDAEMRGRFEAATEAVAKVRHHGECVVIVAHRYESPNRFKVLDRLLEGALRSLAEEGPTVFLCGHSHVAQVDTVMQSRMLVVQGGPPSDGVGMPARALPCAYNIRLERAAGAVTAVTAHRFMHGPDSWLSGGDDDLRRFRWSPKLCRWTLTD